MVALHIQDIHAQKYDGHSLEVDYWGIGIIILFLGGIY